MRLVTTMVAAATWLLAPSAWAVSVDQVPNPRSRGAWVADTNDMIAAPVEARIEEAITAFERERGVEIAVVCVDAVDTATPKDFATQLFNRWGIGKKGKDDGLLVLMVKGERRLEMETGYGLEPVLTDGWLYRMQQDEMVPFFKAGDHGAGLEAGVRASIARLRAYPNGVPPGTDPPPDTAPQTVTGAPGGSGGDWGFLLFGGAMVALGGGYGAWRHRANRTCPQCRVRMSMLPEDEDDVHLDDGQRKEEQLGSIDYQFYQCGRCAHTRLIPNRAWFSGYFRCSRCSYKTSQSTSQTLVSATYDSTGTEEVTTHCEHCGNHLVTRRTTPRLQRSTSSSGGSRSSFGGSSGGSSGGGSFGGGRSGGGGAGSSW